MIPTATNSERLATEVVASAVMPLSSLATPALARHLRHALITITTTATIGNRVPSFELLNGSTIEYQAMAGFTQAASLTNTYQLQNGIHTTTAIAQTASTNFGFVHIPLNFVIRVGWVIRVRDLAAIDAADTATMRLQYNN